MRSRTARSAYPALAAVLFLTTASALSADVFTVGPGGTHTGFEAAIHEALGIAGNHEIRVARGTFPTNVDFQVEGRELEITGDWNASFTARGDDPTRTVLDGGNAEAVIDVFSVENGSLVIETLTFANGISPSGGVRLVPRDNGYLRLQHVVFRDNTAFWTAGDVLGGGLNLAALGSSTTEILDSEFLDNQAVAHATATGGGLGLSAQDTSQVTIRRNRFSGNSVVPANSAALTMTNGGVDIGSFASAVINFSDNEISDNSVEGFDGQVVFAGGQLGLAGSGDPSAGRIVARRNQWLRNTSSSGTLTVQVGLVVGRTGARLELTDSLIAGDGQIGVEALPFDGVLRLTNNTIVGAEDSGVFVSSSAAPISAYNNLFWDNGADISGVTGSLDQGSNLVGVDPLFVNPAAGNYALQPASPAIDAGDPTPPGGLGPFDVTGQGRVVGARVDIGAYEWRTEPCVVTATTLCLVGDRFEVSLGWRPGGGTSSPASAQDLTDDAGYFVFNNPNNIEVVIKMSNACSFNNRFWVFVAGLTNVETNLTVLDTETGEIVTYQNALGTAFAPVQDTSAFATCP